MIDKNKLKALKLVRQNDVVGLHNLICHEKIDLNFMIGGTTLLHEAVSPEMICLLLHRRLNMMQKDCNQKSPEYIWKKKIKSLAKEKELARKKGSKRRFEKLSTQIKQLKNTLQLFKMIKTKVMKNEKVVTDTSDAYLELMKTFHSGVFSDAVNKDVLNKIVLLTAFYAGKTKEYFDKTALYLQKSKYEVEEIKSKLKMIEEQGVNCYLPAKKHSFKPKLLFRGTINPNDKPYPLAHYGSFKAARERLENMSDAIKMKHSEHFDRLGVDVSTLSFQIKPILLKMKNPFRLPEIGKHDFQSYKTLMFHIILMFEKGSDAISDLYEKGLNSDSFVSKVMKMKAPKEFVYMFYHPFQMDADDVKKELQVAGIFPVHASQKSIVNDVNRENLCYQRMIRFFERQGYDGFVYRNGWEDVGQDSYICFRPDSVVELVKADKETLLSPHTIDKKSLSCLNEAEQIAACNNFTINKADARDLFSVDLSYYYKRTTVQRGLDIIKKSVRNLFKNKER